jgi:predicted glutamine amidotransferase
MCELLGMSANVPTDICFSLTALVRRGGDTGPHADGWGIAFYEGKGCRAFHDPEPGARSRIAQFVREYPIKSRIVISHIRRANRGRVGLENTHPFARELWGRQWSFAHNGQVKGIKRRPLSFYRPIGTTDSEHAFCWILDGLRRRWKEPPRHSALVREIAALCHELDGQGVFNALLSDGRTLFAYCSTRLVTITRRAPFGPATLIDDELTVNFAEETTPEDVVTVIATRALTRNETWTPLPRHALTVLRDGGAETITPAPPRGGRKAPGSARQTA